ncbi:MAG TPA: DoxX family protein [Aliidongia sp.]|nr:DoxX family protein [Aliidongia sp.]
MERLAPLAPYLLALLRIMIGLLFVEHGTGKLFGFPTIPMFANLPVMSPAGIAGIFELVGGALILIGLLTRPVAFILSGEMAVAYFMAHAPQGFFPILNGGELAIVYCFAFLYLAAAGGGAWSIDQSRGAA